MVICPWQTVGLEAPSDIPSQAPAQSLPGRPFPGPKNGGDQGQTGMSHGSRMALS